MLPVILGAAALGGIGSWLTGREANKNYNSAMDAYNNNMRGALSGYRSGAQGAIDRYNTQSQQYLNTPEGINRWLNPNMDYQLQQVANANNMQYAADGKMLSGAAMKALQDRSQNMAKLSWQDAFNNMTNSNSQGLSNLQYGTNNQLDLQSNLFNAQQGMYGNQLSGALGKPATGLGAVFSGIGSGLGAGAGVVNAASAAKKAFG